MLSFLFLGKDKTFLKFWMTLEQNCSFDLEGQGQGQAGQGPKFKNFYSRQRQNLSEILNNILKFWTKLHQNCNFELQGQIKGQGQEG